jgi:hypothetical protein
MRLRASLRKRRDGGCLLTERAANSKIVGLRDERFGGDDVEAQ